MTYTSTEVCRLTGCTYRQLDYWCRTNRIAGQAPVGSGHQRRFTTRQVERVRALKEHSDVLRRGLDGVAT